MSWLAATRAALLSCKEFRQVFCLVATSIYSGATRHRGGLLKRADAEMLSRACAVAWIGADRKGDGSGQRIPVGYGGQNRLTELSLMALPVAVVDTIQQHAR